MVKTFFSKAALGVAIALAFAPVTVRAQFSDSYNFIKAVKDRDGNKATEILSKPGTTIVDTRDSATGETGLQIATKRRDIAWMGFLLGKGAKADVRDLKGNTALLHAAQIGFAEGAQLLLKVRASVDLANSAGETPLIRAVQNRDPVMTRILITAGANPAKTDRLAGMSALDYAQRDPRGAAILKILNEAKPAKPVAGPKL